MDINRANMDLFFTQARAEWTQAMNTRRDNLILNKLAMTVPSTTAITTHGWLNQIPSMRKWLGDRQVKNVRSSKLAITNAKFENTIEIPREDFEDDQYGLYLPTFSLMGQDAASLPDRLLIDALLANGNWADSAAVFGTTRKYGSGPVITNHGTDAYTEDGSVLNTWYSTMTSFQGDSGLPLMVIPYAILHGPQLRTKVQKSLTAFGALLASATQVAGQIGNPNAGIVVPVESPYLVDGYTDMDGNTYADAGTHWFLLGAVAGLKGLVYQNRISPELQDQRAKLDSENLMMTDKFQWGARARGAGFISMPHLIIANYATT